MLIPCLHQDWNCGPPDPQPSLRNVTPLGIPSQENVLKSGTIQSLFLRHKIPVSAIAEGLIVKILNIYIMLACTHLYHTSFQYLYITCNVFIACYIRHYKYLIGNYQKYFICRILELVSYGEFGDMYEYRNKS